MDFWLYGEGDDDECEIWICNSVTLLLYLEFCYVGVVWLKVIPTMSA